MWVVGNQIENGTTYQFSVVNPALEYRDTRNIWFEDNSAYNTGSLNLYDDQSYFYNMTFTDNKFYNNGSGTLLGPWIGTYGGSNNWTETNSTYESSTSIPSWTMQ